MSSSLDIRLLGPFEALADGRQAPVTGSKRNALLALLALHRGQVVSVDTLIEALWGEELPSSPRNAVQHHVTRLRSALGADAIAATTEGYALREANVDALEFEKRLAEGRRALRDGDAQAAADAIARGLALWRGAALQGLPDTSWLTAESRRLEALRSDALEAEFDAALALGEHDELVPRIRRALEESPFRERLWGQLMLALYRSGRQADALEAFQEARRVLDEELGLEPGPELQRLQTAILAHDPAVAATPNRPARRGNLPAPVTSFVDREQELERLQTLLREHRLVTVIGPPGVGKSRLALEGARSLEQEFRDGIWLADLARAGDPEDVARLVADALGIDSAGQLEPVTARLRDARAVLLLDDCSRVLSEAARVAATVLAECPEVRVLATSREVLHLAGETRINLAPLPLPNPDAASDAGAPAVELFVQRARTARPDLEVTPDTAELVEEISRRLDGLPLAIELAAARTNVLGLSEILSSLDRRFALLLDGEADGASDESRALKTLVAWSYDLLHGDEKTLLHQLAVHRGGASLPALIAGAAHHGLDEMTATQLVAALVDKSVATVSFPSGEARYGLLDTVRGYAIDRLTQEGGLAAARRAHAEYFASLVEGARDELRGPGWLAALRRLRLENDNLWAAFDYAREAGDSTTTVRLAAYAGWYFALAERISEGRHFLELALPSATDDAPPEPRVELLSNLSYLAGEESDLDFAVEKGTLALRLGEQADLPSATALARVALASALARQGEVERAGTLLADARASFEELGDHWGAAAACLIAAIGAAGAGDAAAAGAFTAATSHHAEAIGYGAFQVSAALLEAWLAERREDGPAAEDAFRRALELSEDAGFADHASFALSGLGSIAGADGEGEQAEALYRRALEVAETASEDWAAAHARVGLAAVLAARGDLDTAEELRRAVVESSRTRRPHQGRESLFFALAGAPEEAAAQALEAAAPSPPR